MPQLVPPHNSEQVKPLLLPETERAEARKRAEKLRKIPLDSRAVSDVFMLAMGAYTPLDGFMGHDDWRGSCRGYETDQRRLLADPDHTFRSKDLADSIHAEEEVALVDAETGEILAVMEVQREIFDRQATRGRARLSHRRSEASRRSESPASGGCQSGRARLVLSEGEYPAKYPTSISARPVAGDVS